MKKYEIKRYACPALIKRKLFSFSNFKEAKPLKICHLPTGVIGN